MDKPKSSAVSDPDVAVSVESGGSGGPDPKYFKRNSERRCTDVLCLIFFFCFWIGMLIICGVSVKSGNPKK